MGRESKYTLFESESDQRTPIEVQNAVQNAIICPLESD